MSSSKIARECLTSNGTSAAAPKGKEKEEDFKEKDFKERKEKDFDDRDRLQ